MCCFLQDDLQEWEEVQKALQFMQMTSTEIESIFSIVSGVLLLGNIHITCTEKQGFPDAADLNPENQQLLMDACQLLFLDPILVREGLLVRISKAGGQEIRGAWKAEEANLLKDSLAKVGQIWLVGHELGIIISVETFWSIDVYN